MTKDAQFALRRGKHAVRLALFVAALSNCWQRSATCRNDLVDVLVDVLVLLVQRSGSTGTSCSLDSGYFAPQQLSELTIVLVWCSDREVHEEHALLPDLQLCQQDHSGAAVAVHALPLPAARTVQCAGTAAPCRQGRKVRLPLLHSFLQLKMSAVFLQAESLRANQLCRCLGSRSSPCFRGRQLSEAMIKQSRQYSAQHGDWNLGCNDWNLGCAG